MHCDAVGTQAIIITCLAVAREMVKARSPGVGVNMPDDIQAAARCRRRAEELREAAEAVSDAAVKQTLLNVADEYERIAQSRDRLAETDRNLRR